MKSKYNNIMKLLEENKKLLDKLDELNAHDKAKLHKVATVSLTAPSQTTEVFVEAGSVNIPTDRYLEVAPGIHDRVYTGTFLDEVEREIFEPKLNKMDLSNDKLNTILVLFRDEGKFQAHVHSTDEFIYMVSGIIHDDVNGVKIFSGDNYYIPAFKVHSFIVESAGACIIRIKPIGNSIGTATEESTEQVAKRELIFDYINKLENS